MTTQRSRSMLSEKLKTEMTFVGQCVLVGGALFAAVRFVFN